MYAWVRVRARIIAFSYTRVGVIHEYGNGNSGGRRDFAKTRGTSGVNENKKIKKNTARTRENESRDRSVLNNKTRYTARESGTIRPHGLMMRARARRRVVYVPCAYCFIRVSVRINIAS